MNPSKHVRNCEHDRDGLSNRGQNMAAKSPPVTDETADNSNAVIRGNIRDGSSDVAKTRLPTGMEPE